MVNFKEAFDNAMGQLTGKGGPFEIVNEVFNNIDYKVIKTAPPTLQDIWAQGATFGDKEFLVYEDERYTYNDMLQQAASIGHQLVNEYDVRKGDRVAIAMRNYPEWMTAFIAITSVGGVAVTLNSWGKAKDLEFGITDAGARIVFCDQQRLDFIADRLVELDIKAIVARPEKDTLPENAIALQDLIAGQESATMPKVDVGPDDPVLMMYTSGTTGNPKGAVSTHRALCQALANIDASAAAMAMINPEAIEDMMNKGFEPTQMLAVPLFHVSGCHAVFLGAFKGGRRVVMMYKWGVDRALELIERERITFLSAAPSMLQQMLESPSLEKADVSSLWALGGGGSATPPKVARMMEERFPKGYPGTGWGLTETNAIGTSFTGNPFRANPRAAGFANPGVEIQARDEEGNPLPAGVAGELWIKSLALVKEYWNRPDANAKDFRDGWFNSGDIGYFSEEGYLFLSDRSKDMIIRSGENIYPAEIEASISDHPKVEEVAAFGVPDEKTGEAVAVVVVPKDGETVSEEDVLAYAKENLAGYKVPQHVWLLDHALPRNPTGKVLKKDLKVEYLKQGQSA